MVGILILGLWVGWMICGIGMMFSESILLGIIMVFAGVFAGGAMLLRLRI